MQSIIEQVSLLVKIDENTVAQINKYIEKMDVEKKKLINSLKVDIIKELVVCCYNDVKNIFKDGKVDYNDIVYFIDMIKNLFETIKNKELNLEKQAVFALCEVICQILILALNTSNFELELFEKLLSSSVNLLEFDFTSLLKEGCLKCC